MTGTKRRRILLWQRISDASCEARHSGARKSTYRSGLPGRPMLPTLHYTATHGALLCDGSSPTDDVIVLPDSIRIMPHGRCRRNLPEQQWGSPGVVSEPPCRRLQLPVQVQRGTVATALHPVVGPGSPVVLWRGEWKPGNCGRGLVAWCTRARDAG